MRNLTKGKQPINGMQLVKWYVNFVERIAPDSWTFENVRAPQIKSFMTEKGITHGYFNFVDYGVPQTRKRCLAGTHDIIHAFRTDRSLLVATPQSPLNVLTPPSQAVYIRASGGKCTDYFYRTVSEPTWSLLCACKPVYAAHDQSCIRVMHIREMLRIQTFPDSYRMKSSGHLGMLGSESDRVRLVGNAVPPLIAAMLVEIATRL
jgi:site-specific DNA-cytosine methylase